MNLVYDTVLWTNEGISKAARNYFSALSSHFDNIIATDIRWDSRYTDAETIRQKWGLVDFSDENNLVYLKNTRPEMWPYINYGHMFGFHVFEGDMIPLKQSEGINNSNMKAVFVPSEYMRQMMYNSNITKPVEVIPHALPDGYNFKEKKEKTKTTFLFSGAIFGVSDKDRKGLDLILNMWKDFEDDEDKLLILKLNTMYAQNMYAQQGLAFSPIKYLTDLYGKNLPRNIRVLDKDMSEKELIMTYHYADCILYPTRGEGFGLVPFEGLACGTPVIVTENQGCEEYLNDKCGGFLRIKSKGKAPAENRPPYNENGLHINWDEPSLSDFKFKVNEFINNKAQYITEAKSSSEYIHNNFNKEIIGRYFYDSIKRYIE